ncbi:MAG: adenylate/guanylate cyclase domain-containing protein [Mariprofundaceae bacterium]|nr:adenylate/guanylate cyclase domain-containing protein [Mariprofundaceae bacterium]
MKNIPPMRSFLPQETVAMIEKYGSDLSGDLAFDQEMTILFSDMRGFTELAEKYEPREVYATINASLSMQTGIIMRHGGSINKFLGDGLLACFSGENRGEQALLCMLELITELQKSESSSDKLPCRVGFGMHDGHVLFGLLGDEMRKEFAVIGDVPNTAARLCGIAQPFQGLMTEACMRIIPDDLAKKYCRYLNSVYFKGKRDGMDVFYVDVES